MSETSSSGTITNNSTKGQEDITVNTTDIQKLIKSLKLDNSHQEIKDLLEKVKQGRAVSREALMETITALLLTSSDIAQLGDLTESVDENFQLELL